MRKPVALILGAIMALSLAPIVSRASAQCPGVVRDEPNAAGVSTGYKYGPVLDIASGPQALPDNPVNVTGLQDLGEYGCDYQATNDNGVDTNYLAPGAMVLKVIAYNYPSDTDHPVSGGCIKFNGVPTTTCTGTGEIKLSWKFINTNVRACFCWRSQTITIPGAPQSTAPGSTLTVTARVPLTPDHGTTKTSFTRTYRAVGP